MNCYTCAGRVLVIGLTAASATSILIIGSVVGFYIWKHRTIQKKRNDSSQSKVLNWEKRFEIIIGIAEGLVYLHENRSIRIIHRDIKASNILLDTRLRAIIADFGLARSFQEDKSHINTAIAGTLQNNKSKTTEYSDSLAITAWKHFQRRTVEELFDPNLMLNNQHIISIKNEILRVVHIALLCTQKISSLRPFMSKALEMLVRKEQLPAPTVPPFVDENTMEFNEMGENVLLPLEHGNAASVAIKLLDMLCALLA
ncbi:hypothetical protein BUALT_Bualt05G0159300 [Buddleja alternifolia]|uniref:non-specific serine/threonine protein kinase n=1 Tax=Buddleja alternifolia TaxID=168488 RepID=A0AAV6XNY1_9LAMI|nr:hypothetical protein BUALT_Bualt05G0159300 [Buddleja alternifolia]